MHDLTILVVSWNTRDLLLRCLESVIDTKGELDCEIVVVDNASEDGTAEAVQSAFPEIHLVVNDENLGFAKANNLGIRTRQARHALLLNPDTEMLPGALKRLVEFMDAHTTAGAAGSMLLNADGSLQPSCHPFPTVWREFWRLFHLDAVLPWAQYRMQRWNQQVARQVDVVQGACLILRWSALQQVGLFDEEYFIYSEEVDLCYRMRQCGWQVWWVPVARVVHHGGQSTRQVAAEMFLRLYAGKILFIRKHHGVAAARVYKVILFLAALTRIALSPFAIFFARGDSSDRRRLARAYKELLFCLPRLGYS